MFFMDTLLGPPQKHKPLCPYMEELRAHGAREDSENGSMNPTENPTKTQLSRLRGDELGPVTDTHAALHVFQLWQDVQSEAVSLPPRTIPSVHEVAKSQHEAEDPQNTRTALESLEPEANETRSQS